MTHKNTLKFRSQLLKEQKHIRVKTERKIDVAGPEGFYRDPQYFIRHSIRHKIKFSHSPTLQALEIKSQRESVK